MEKPKEVTDAIVYAEEVVKHFELGGYKIVQFVKDNSVTNPYGVVLAKGKALIQIGIFQVLTENIGVTRVDL